MKNEPTLHSTTCVQPTPFLSASQIKRAVQRLGREISKDCNGDNPLLLCILKGASFFHADLCRQLTIPATIDFIAVASYGANTHSTGEVRLLKDTDTPLAGRHLVVVEDIVDTGMTLNYLREALVQRGVTSLKICTLLNKPSRRVVEVPVDYIGFEIPDVFVVGYGLDWNERYRHLPYIGIFQL